MDGKYWTKVSKRGIPKRKGAKIENLYLNAHLHIGQKYQKGKYLREKGLKLKTFTLMLIYISI